MARTMTMESIDAKIQKAEEKVVRTGKTYNTACEELKKLRDKKLTDECLLHIKQQNNTLLQTVIYHCDGLFLWALRGKNLLT